MSFKTDGLKHGFFTAANANIERNRFLKQVGTTVDHADAAGKTVGVCLLDNPVSGQAVPVQYTGVVMVEASAAISANAEVEVATGGKAVTYSAGVKVGIALEAASGSGSIIPVLLKTSYAS